jgi:hypothetical protein
LNLSLFIGRAGLILEDDFPWIASEGGLSSIKRIDFYCVRHGSLLSLKQNHQLGLNIGDEQRRGLDNSFRSIVAATTTMSDD